MYYITWRLLMAVLALKWSTELTPTVRLSDQVVTPHASSHSIIGRCVPRWRLLLA